LKRLCRMVLFLYWYVTPNELLAARSVLNVGAALQVIYQISRNLIYSCMPMWLVGFPSSSPNGLIVGQISEYLGDN
jgi:hypothetical protein